MTALQDEIRAKCTTEQITSRDEAAISEAIGSRTRFNLNEIGNGMIIDTIGIAAGNALLDVISNTPDFRYVKPLVEQGRLRIGSVLVQETLQSMVPSVITQEHADKIKALGIDSYFVSVYDIANALEGI